MNIVLNFNSHLKFFSLIVIVFYDPSMKLLITPKSQYLCLCLWSTLIIWGESQSYLGTTVEKTFDTFLKNKNCISVYLLLSYFLSLIYLLSFMPLLHCFDYHSFITSLKVRRVVLLFCSFPGIGNCCGYFSSFEYPYKF